MPRSLRIDPGICSGGRPNALPTSCASASTPLVRAHVRACPPPRRQRPLQLAGSRSVRPITPAQTLSRRRPLRMRRPESPLPGRGPPMSILLCSYGLAIKMDTLVPEDQVPFLGKKLRAISGLFFFFLPPRAAQTPGGPGAVAWYFTAALEHHAVRRVLLDHGALGNFLPRRSLARRETFEAAAVFCPKLSRRRGRVPLPKSGISAGFSPLLRSNRIRSVRCRSSAAPPIGRAASGRMR